MMVDNGFIYILSGLKP